MEISVIYRRKEESGEGRRASSEVQTDNRTREAVERKLCSGVDWEENPLLCCLRVLALAALDQSLSSTALKG
jgi:hypothetical protein